MNLEHGNRVPPIVINFMLVCHWSPKPAEELGEDHWDSIAGRETREWLYWNELIDRKDDFATSTEKGKAWIEFICATPLPEAKWVLPGRAP